MKTTHGFLMLTLGFLGCSTSSPGVPTVDAIDAGGAASSTGGRAGAGSDAAAGGGQPTGGGGGGAGRALEDAPTIAVDAALDVTSEVTADVTTAGDAGDAGDAISEAGSGCSGLFCEDFEQGQIDTTKWDLLTGAGGTLMVQQQTVAHGKYALQVHGVAGPSDYGLIVTKKAPASLQGAHYGRAYFFITPKPLTSGHTQMVFAGMNGTGAANGPGPLPKLRYLEVANINGGWQIGFDLLDIAPLVEEVAYPAGSPQVPVVSWTCLEWQFNDQPDSINLWVDGKAIGTFDDQHVSYPSGHPPGTPLYNGKSSGLIGGFNLFGFGFHDWHPNKPFDIFYDDIVLDVRRVGCLP